MISSEKKKLTWFVESFNRFELSIKFPATTNRMILLKIDCICLDGRIVGCVNELTRYSSWLNIIEVSDKRKPEANKIYLEIMFQIY